MQQRAATKEQPITPTGVIDAIADGLSIVLVRPWLFLLPMLLDLWFWTGWKVKPAGLVEPIRRWLIDYNTTDSLDLADRMRGWSAVDITWIVSLLVPSLLSDAKRGDIYTVGDRPIWTPDGWALNALLIVVALLAAALMLAIFSVPLADAALERTRSLSETVRAITVGWIRILCLVGAAIGIGMLISAPLFVGWVALMFAGVNAAPLVGFVGLIAGMALFVGLWFAPDSIFVNEVGPLRSIYYSVAVVRAYFWQTLGFVGASMLITLGLGEIWLRLAENAPGLLLGVIMNAFFASGVSLASMVFFASRIRSLKPESVRHTVP